MAPLRVTVALRNGTRDAAGAWRSPPPRARPAPATRSRPPTAAIVRRCQGRAGSRRSRESRRVGGGAAHAWLRLSHSAPPVLTERVTAPVGVLVVTRNYEYQTVYSVR